MTDSNLSFPHYYSNNEKFNLVSAIPGEQGYPVSKLNEFVSLPACVVSQLTKVRRFKLESSLSKFERWLVAAAKGNPCFIQETPLDGKLSMQRETYPLRVYETIVEADFSRSTN